MAKIKKKVSRSQTAPGEELRSLTDSMIEYYQAYSKQFNTVTTILAVALVTALLFSYVKAGKERKAAQMFDAAYSFYAPPGAAMPDYPRSLEGFEEVVKQYGTTLHGAIAQYYVGNALAGMGRLEDALKAYEEVTSRYAGRKFLQSMVQTRMGYAYAALGNRESAVQAFTSAETTGGTGPATLELARIYERIGNTDDAQRKYQELSERLPATSLALEARSKLPPPDLKKTVGDPEGTAGR